MTTTTTTTKTNRKQRKAPEAVHGSARWVGGMATQGQLDNGEAVLQVTVAGKDPAFYFVATNKDDDGLLLGWRLVKIDALDKTSTYDVEITPHGLRCDCPDATYADRPGGCKHVCGLRAGLKAAGLAG